MAIIAMNEARVEEPVPVPPPIPPDPSGETISYGPILVPGVRPMVGGDYSLELPVWRTDRAKLPK